ncbi:MAG: hypothetical protein ACLQVI_11780 [Polyangiaceae bacterium]|jgi:hypothetical protein
MSRVVCCSAILATALSAATFACSAAPGKSAPSGGGSTGSTPGTAQGNGAAPANPAADAGAADGIQAVTESGKIVAMGSDAVVAGAVVTAGDQTATTAADGTFSLTLQKGETFQLSVVADGYATLLMQQTSLVADYDAGSTTVVPNATASLLTSILSGYDSTLGVLSIAVEPTGACTDEGGATVAVSPAGSSRVVYMSGGIPNSSLTAVKEGEFPSAVIYNAAPNVPLTVTVTHPTCTQVAFPVTQNGVEYTGEMSTEAGEVTGFARIFLQ